MKIHKLLIVCSALDLKLPLGTTPAWWQLFKGLHELGVELVVTPYRGGTIRSLWWRCYKNPSKTLGTIYNFANSKIINNVSGDKKTERFVPRLAQSIVRPKWEKHLKKILIKEQDVDAVLFLQVPLNHLKGIPTFIKRKFDLPIVYFDGDMPIALPRHGGYKFNYYIGADLAEYDMFIVNSESVLEDLKDMGAQDIGVVHYGADPSAFSPVDVQQNIDVFFYGLGYKLRKNWFIKMMTIPSKTLKDSDFAIGGLERWEGIDLGLARCLGSVPFNAWRSLCCRSKINLNITRSSHAEMYATSCSRPFELGALGCCIVSNPYKGLEKWFKIGEEMFIVKDEKEAIELYRWLLSSEDVRLKVGRKARQRVLKEHTFKHRAKRLLSFLEKLI